MVGAVEKLLWYSDLKARKGTLETLDIFDYDFVAGLIGSRSRLDHGGLKSVLTRLEELLPRRPGRNSRGSSYRRSP